MTRLLGSAMTAAAVAVLLAAQLGAQSSPKVRARDAGARAAYAPPRTADGHPDMQGYWTNGTYTPLERPAEFANKEFLTREEAAAYAKRRDDQLRAQPRDNIHYDDAIWQSERDAKGLTSLRTSLIYDPPDGKIPPMTAEGQRRADARAAERKLRGPADSAQARALSERCILWPHEGPPMLPAGYFPNLQIVQGPNVFVVMQEIIHNARVIPYDDRRPLGPAIRNYRGESRGRWEGDTLVVETTNFTEATQFRGSSAALKVTERFTMLDRDTIQYRFTVDDPTTWARPWSAEIPMIRTEDPIYEYACHEGNYGLPNILRAQRVADK
ncbi:MAG TPA: hypothetical protein VFO31_15055 [Vicinamibacterales bacterium]|nr:hypothetical protein [Vicinamibacterales bacterium]